MKLYFMQYVGIIQDFQDFDAYLDKNIDNFD